MRVLALIFALIGAAGAGLMGFIMLDAFQKVEADFQQAEAQGKIPPIKFEEIQEIRNLKRAIYGMIAGVPLGVVGGYLALSRKGKLAALLLVITYAVPFAILAVGVGVDLNNARVKPILFFPAGFLVAAFFSLFIRPWQPPSRARERGIDEDFDMVG